MKPTLLLSALALVLSPLNASLAQRIIQKTLPVKTSQSISLNFRFGDSIQIRYWDKSELSVRISASINNGKLDDALLVTSETTDSEVQLKTDLDQKQLEAGKAEDCPDKHYTWHSKKDGKEHFVCSQINYQVFLPRHAKLKVETINGNIDIQGASEAVVAKTISGFVDLSWPKTKGATVAMKTITGEVYSNLDIAFTSKREKHPIVGYQLEGDVLGGGPTLKLESISNHIYLRRQE